MGLEEKEYIHCFNLLCLSYLEKKECCNSFQEWPSKAHRISSGLWLQIFFTSHERLDRKRELLRGLWIFSKLSPYKF
jgi:hypothetical protein